METEAPSRKFVLRTACDDNENATAPQRSSSRRFQRGCSKKKRPIDGLHGSAQHLSSDAIALRKIHHTRTQFDRPVIFVWTRLCATVYT